ncbi:MAG: PHP domain-containing protein, partial [Oscillospiraceae bacterium]
MPADLHCHTRLSDGSLGIEDLIILANKMGVDTIAITDHDCLAATVRGKIIGERHGVTVVPGVELSAFDTKRERKVHILCYLSDNPDRLEGLCRRNSLARRKAGQLMVLKTAQKYPITPEFVLKCAAGSTNIYKQHILHALMESGFTTEIFGNMYDELFSSKNPDNISVLPKFPDVFEVMDAIHESGGIAVLAHPGFYDSFELLDELIKAGLDGVEVWHPENTPEESQRLIEIAKKNGLLMT